MKLYFIRSKNILALVICLFSASLTGQYTTVIRAANKADKIDIKRNLFSFTFDLSSIPKSATIQSCKLQLTVGSDINEKLTLDSKIGDSRFGYMYLDPSFKEKQVFYIEGSKDLITNLLTSGNHTVQMALQVRSEKRNIEATIIGNGNQNPRLVIAYSLPPSPPVDWSMSRADGQHSGSTFMRFAGASSMAYQGKQISTFGDIQKDLVMYKYKIYVYESLNSQTSLYSIDPLSKSKTLIADYLNSAVTMPIIDREGRLYHFSKNEVVVIELDNNNKRSTVISIDQNSVFEGSPTIGPDGSLYLSFNNAIVAYSPFPVLQKIWQHGISGTKTSITLNQEGTIAYFASYANNKLIALNTINGNTIHENAVLLIEENNVGTTIPLVSNDGHVFITNKLLNATKMYAFDSELVQQKLIEGKQISQPVSGKKTDVFFVKDGTLHQYNSGLQIPFIGGVAVRSLVADKSNNIYCLGMDNKLYVYNNTNKSIAKSNASSTAFQWALVVAKDGSAYTATSSSIFGFRLEATTSYPAYTLTSNDAQLNNTAFSGKTLTVPANFKLSKDNILIGVNGVQVQENASILGTAETIIQSGKSISFKKGFRVKKGARLICKTGY